MVKDLFEILPKVTAQFFVEFREGRISFHELKLESLGLDHTMFLTTAKILEIAFPPEDLPFLPVWMQEKRAKIVKKLKAKIAEEEADNQDKNLRESFLNKSNAISHHQNESYRSPSLASQPDHSKTGFDQTPADATRASADNNEGKDDDNERDMKSADETQELKKKGKPRPFETDEGYYKLSGVFTEKELGGYQEFRDAVRDWMAYDTRYLDKYGRQRAPKSETCSQATRAQRRAQSSAAAAKAQKKLLTETESNEIALRESYDAVKDLLFIKFYQ